MNAEHQPLVRSRARVARAARRRRAIAKDYPGLCRRPSTSRSSSRSATKSIASSARRCSRQFRKDRRRRSSTTSRSTTNRRQLPRPRAFRSRSEVNADDPAAGPAVPADQESDSGRLLHVARRARRGAWLHGQHRTRQLPLLHRQGTLRADPACRRERIDWSPASVSNEVCMNSRAHSLRKGVAIATLASLALSPAQPILSAMPQQAATRSQPARQRNPQQPRPSPQQRRQRLLNLSTAVGRALTRPRAAVMSFSTSRRSRRGRINRR